MAELNRLQEKHVSSTIIGERRAVSVFVIKFFNIIFRNIFIKFFLILIIHNKIFIKFSERYYLTVIKVFPCMLVFEI